VTGRREGHAATLVLWVAVLLPMSPVSALGQATSAPAAPASRPVELTVTGALTGPTTFGGASADLLRPDGGTTSLFRTENRLGTGFGVELDLGVGLTRRLFAEATGSWIHAGFETRVTSDLEGADDVTLTESGTRFSVEGAGLVQVATLAGGDLFARGSAGWMRELAGEGALIEDGITGSAGVVYRRWWHQGAPGARMRGLGVRVDGRLSMRSAGLTLGERKMRVAPFIAFGIVFGF
jgi:hypothetical protein